MGTEALSATTSTSSTISVDPTSKSELARSERIAEKYIGKFCDLRARIEKYDLSPHGKNEDFMISRDFSKVLEEALGLQIVPSSKRRILVSALDALLLLPQHERGSYLPSRTPQEILCASMLELGMYKQALKLAKGMSSDYSDDKSCVLSGISDALVIANMGRAKYSNIAFSLGPRNIIGSYVFIRKYNKKIEEWATILEKHNMASIHYPPIGEPEIIKWKQ